MKHQTPAAMLWTGGKDSALALELSRDRFDVRFLATFAPAQDADFKAHPLALMRAQANALDIAHHVFVVEEPYRDGYISALAKIRDRGVQTVITGDIAPVDGHPNWIAECAAGLLDTSMPLWDADRRWLLETLVKKQFDVRISLAWRKHFARCLAGRQLDKQLIDDLLALEPEGVDICGENGEYHSSVLNAPGFRWPLALSGESIESTDDYWRLTWDSVDTAS